VATRGRAGSGHSPNRDKTACFDRPDRHFRWTSGLTRYTKPLSSFQDLCTLYIATASTLGGDAHRLASLFALDVHVPGAAAFRAKV
jgi:hypothetical protein